MSVYHLIGIDRDGKMQSLMARDLKDEVMSYAKRAASRYKQMFLISQSHNVREVKVSAELGDFAPVVNLEF